MRKLRTYLVEDSAVIREGLIATLEELGSVCVVGCAEEEVGALRWLSLPANAAELVIVDIFLKAGSGLGLLRAVAGMTPARCLIVLSNYATPEMRRRCLELGATRVFDKSNDIEALLAYCVILASAHGDGSAPADDAG
jgi:two-component system, OmpR family, response regulator